MARQPKEPKRKKTIHGGGTIYLRNDGRYVASIKDPNSGKRIDRYAKTEKEAEKKREDIKYEIRQNTLATGSNQTVQQYLTHWLEDVQKHEVREASYIQNRSIIQKQIIPAIGHIQMKKLTAQHMQRFYADKVREGLKPNSIGAIQNIMHKALKNAVRWKLVSQNVCDQVTVPRGGEIEPTAHPLTAEQALHLLKKTVPKKEHQRKIPLLGALGGSQGITRTIVARRSSMSYGLGMKRRPRCPMRSFSASLIRLPLRMIIGTFSSPSIARNRLHSSSAVMEGSW
jgi:hypothetical protein